MLFLEVGLEPVEVCLVVLVYGYLYLVLLRPLLAVPSTCSSLGPVALKHLLVHDRGWALALLVPIVQWIQLAIVLVLPEVPA